MLILSWSQFLNEQLLCMVKFFRQINDHCSKAEKHRQFLMVFDALRELVVSLVEITQQDLSLFF
jgi:hypothetical protein